MNEEMNRLCKLIQDEKDHQKFTTLIAKLIEVIAPKERRLEELDAEKSSTTRGLAFYTVRPCALSDSNSTTIPSRARIAP